MAQANPINTLMQEANQEFGKGNFEEAAQKYDELLAMEIVKTTPAILATISTNRGATLQRLGRFEEAIEMFSQVLSVKEDHVEALHNRGVAYKCSGKLEEAIADFNAATDLNDEFWSSYCGLSETLAEMKMFDEALAASELAIKHCPTTKCLLGAGKTSSDLKAALTNLSTSESNITFASFCDALELSQDEETSVQLYFELAKCGGQSKPSQETELPCANAMALFQKFNSKSRQARTDRAFCKLRLEDWDGSIQAYEDILENDVASKAVQNCLAVCYIRKSIEVSQKEGGLEEAVSFADKSLALVDSFDRRLQKAIYLMRLLKWDEIIETLKGAEEDNSQCKGEAYAILGAVWMKKKDWEKAFKFLGPMGATNPGLIDTIKVYSKTNLFTNLACVCVNLDKLEEAKIYYGEILKLDPDNSGAKSNIEVLTMAIKQQAETGSSGMAEDAPKVEDPPKKKELPKPKAKKFGKFGALMKKSLKSGALEKAVDKMEKDMAAEEEAKAQGESSTSSSESAAENKAHSRVKGHHRGDTHNRSGKLIHTYDSLKRGQYDSRIVDPTRREQYLSDEDFNKIFGMDMESFNKLKKWRQQKVKREVDLF
eukprot:g587.t1